MMNTPRPRRIRRAIRALWLLLTTPYNHAAALRLMLEAGKEIGRHETPPVIYISDHCPRHVDEKLIETAYGEWKCPRCFLFSASQVQLVTRPMDTESLPRIRAVGLHTRFGVHVHHALEAGVPLGKAIAEYQSTHKVPYVRFPGKEESC